MSTKTNLREDIEKFLIDRTRSGEADWFSLSVFEGGSPASFSWTTPGGDECILQKIVTYRLFWKKKISYKLTIYTMLNTGFNREVYNGDVSQEVWDTVIEAKKKQLIKGKEAFEVNFYASNKF